ncbi:MAG: sigma-70 family RNA polymerase sigma factor [Phycisphaeraceae bacterium]|nr:sigma-70 family RNA polymerase sigma factor [Phycisphaeraceae bacterium]
MTDTIDLSEHRLAAEASKGDPEAIRALWADHRRWVAAVLLAHKPKDADLEDLLQEVALTLVRRVHELRDGAALRGWLRTVALNVARARGRDTARRRRRDAGHREVVARLGATGHEPMDPAEREEASRVLGQAQQLPDSYREALILRCVHGMSYRQIGEALGLPETTVETRIARGRRMLREILAHQGAESAQEVTP